MRITEKSEWSSHCSTFSDFFTRRSRNPRDLCRPNGLFLGNRKGLKPERRALCLFAWIQTKRHWHRKVMTTGVGIEASIPETESRRGRVRMARANKIKWAGLLIAKFTIAAIQTARGKPVDFYRSNAI